MTSTSTNKDALHLASSPRSTKRRNRPACVQWPSRFVNAHRGTNSHAGIHDTSADFVRPCCTDPLPPPADTITSTSTSATNNQHTTTSAVVNRHRHIPSGCTPSSVHVSAQTLPPPPPPPSTKFKRTVPPVYIRGQSPPPLPPLPKHESRPATSNRKSKRHRLG